MKKKAVCNHPRSGDGSSMSACNYQLVDTTYSYKYAVAETTENGE